MDKQEEAKPAKKEITVDQNKCIGCGLCVSICPDVFELRDDGKSHVKNAEGCAKCNCQQALDSCPAKAISWSE